MKNYLCKIATEEEMNIRWDYLIDSCSDDSNWIIWKKENIDRFKNNKIIPYYGLLNGEIICEATAMINKEFVQNNEIYFIKSLF